MALRHAVLAALLDGEFSGYQLTKIFDVGVSDFWYATPQQLYAELAKMETDGLLTGRRVVQRGRPDKRVFTVTGAGLAELAAFAAAPAKPLLIRDDLIVKVHACDLLAPGPLIAQLQERAAEAAAKLELFGKMLLRLRGELEEEEFLRRGERVGPYLTCLGGLRLERQMHEWCLQTARTLSERAVRDGTAQDESAQQEKGALS
ncbi:PadR family transcriptional regulator [Planobispora takensis]|uniref:PadR family transcriptional regulator n=1 Tax=Planobispora takensis TaxID=1367882 RepID=A0A8J3T6K4_9ACTN|nr:PadR family transcriptional regulator [Planobispora takensis]GII05855.1 PadR family transcriptional regulator [Planobispora takensis]